jgi:hypothetical protein
LCGQLRREGVDAAYFLARDGRVMKQAYDRVRALCAELPPATYLWASRRGTCLPGIRTVEQLPALLDLPAAPLPLRALLAHRFALTDADLAGVQSRDFGFESWDVSVRVDADRRQLGALLEALATPVLAAASA